MNEQPTEDPGESDGDPDGLYRYPLWFLPVMVAGLLCLCCVGLAIKREV